MKESTKEKKLLEKMEFQKTWRKYKGGISQELVCAYKDCNNTFKTKDGQIKFYCSPKCRTMARSKKGRRKYGVLG